MCLGVSSDIAQVCRRNTSQETQETQEQTTCGSVVPTLVPTPPFEASGVEFVVDLPFSHPPKAAAEVRPAAGIPDITD